MSSKERRKRYTHLRITNREWWVTERGQRLFSLQCGRRIVKKGKRKRTRFKDAVEGVDCPYCLATAVTNKVVASFEDDMVYDLPF